MSRPFRVIGKPIRRVDGRAKVTGRTIFADDIFLPRMLHTRMLRSTLSHAKILSIDTSKAEKLEGVRIGPRSIASQRKRLGLTRKAFAVLAGVSSNTIYLWETGEVAPREKSRGVLVGLRKLGAREAKKLVEAAAEKEKPASPTRRPKRGKRKGRGQK